MIGAPAGWERGGLEGSTAALLRELAELLLEKEVIFSEDLQRIFGKRKGELVKEAEEIKNNKALENKNKAEVKKTEKGKVSKKKEPSSVKAKPKE